MTETSATCAWTGGRRRRRARPGQPRRSATRCRRDDRLLGRAQWTRSPPTATCASVVVTGEGTAFCSGGDTSWIASEPDATVDGLRTRMIAFYRAWLSIRRLEVPTIAAVNGPAIGAGLCLALACDLRYAAGAPGWARRSSGSACTPGMAATYLLPDVVGEAHARDLLLTGRDRGGRGGATPGPGHAGCSPADVFLEEVLDRRRASPRPRRSPAGTPRWRCAAVGTRTSRRACSGRRWRSRSPWPPRTCRRGSPRPGRSALRGSPAAEPGRSPTAAAGLRRTGGRRRRAGTWRGPRPPRAVACLPLANAGPIASRASSAHQPRAGPHAGSNGAILHPCGQRCGRRVDRAAGAVEHRGPPVHGAVGDTPRPPRPRP